MRYMIASEDLGLFLGTQISSLLGDSGKILVIFAATDVFGIYKATSFDSEEDANRYIEEFLSKKYKNLRVLPIEVKEKYVSAIDAIKAGYEQYTHMMVDNLPMQSETVH